MPLHQYGYLLVLHCGTFTSHPLVPEQLTAVWILLVVNGELQDAAEVERQPAQSEDQDQAEHCLGNLPSLDMHIKTCLCDQSAQ